MAIVRFQCIFFVIVSMQPLTLGRSGRREKRQDGYDYGVCSKLRGICHQICVDLPNGNFRCQCKTGFHLLPNKRSCRKTSRWSNSNGGSSNFPRNRVSKKSQTKSYDVVKAQEMMTSYPSFSNVKNLDKSSDFSPSQISPMTQGSPTIKHGGKRSLDFSPNRLSSYIGSKNRSPGGPKQGYLFSSLNNKVISKQGKPTRLRRLRKEYLQRLKEKRKNSRHELSSTKDSFSFGGSSSGVDRSSGGIGSVANGKEIDDSDDVADAEHRKNTLFRKEDVRYYMPRRRSFRRMDNDDNDDDNKHKHHHNLNVGKQKSFLKAHQGIGDSKPLGQKQKRLYSSSKHLQMLKMQTQKQPEVGQTKNRLHRHHNGRESPRVHNTRRNKFINVNDNIKHYANDQPVVKVKGIRGGNEDGSNVGSFLGGDGGGTSKKSGDDKAGTGTTRNSLLKSAGRNIFHDNPESKEVSDLSKDDKVNDLFDDLDNVNDNSKNGMVHDNVNDIKNKVGDGDTNDNLNDDVDSDEDDDINQTKTETHGSSKLTITSLHPHTNGKHLENSQASLGKKRHYLAKSNANNNKVMDLRALMLKSLRENYMDPKLAALIRAVRRHKAKTAKTMTSSKSSKISTTSKTSSTSTASSKTSSSASQTPTVSVLLKKSPTTTTSSSLSSLNATPMSSELQSPTTYSLSTPSTSTPEVNRFHMKSKPNWSSRPPVTYPSNADKRSELRTTENVSLKTKIDTLPPANQTSSSSSPSTLSSSSSTTTTTIISNTFLTTSNLLTEDKIIHRSPQALKTTSSSEIYQSKKEIYHDNNNKVTTTRPTFVYEGSNHDETPDIHSIKNTQSQTAISESDSIDDEMITDLTPSQTAPEGVQPVARAKSMKKGKFMFSMLDIGTKMQSLGKESRAVATFSASKPEVVARHHKSRSKGKTNDTKIMPDPHVERNSVLKKYPKSETIPSTVMPISQFQERVDFSEKDHDDMTPTLWNNLGSVVGDKGQSMSEPNIETFQPTGYLEKDTNFIPIISHNGKDFEETDAEKLKNTPIEIKVKYNLFSGRKSSPLVIRKNTPPKKKDVPTQPRAPLTASKSSFQNGSKDLKRCPTGLTPITTSIGILCQFEPKKMVPPLRNKWHHDSLKTIQFPMTSSAPILKFKPPLKLIRCPHGQLPTKTRSGFTCRPFHTNNRGIASDYFYDDTDGTDHFGHYDNDDDDNNNEDDDDDDDDDDEENGNDEHDNDGEVVDAGNNIKGHNGIGFSDDDVDDIDNNNGYYLHSRDSNHRHVLNGDHNNNNNNNNNNDKEDENNGDDNNESNNHNKAVNNNSLDHFSKQMIIAVTTPSWSSKLCRNDEILILKHGVAHCKRLEENAELCGPEFKPRKDKSGRFVCAEVEKPALECPAGFYPSTNQGLLLCLPSNPHANLCKDPGFVALFGYQVNCTGKRNLSSILVPCEDGYEPVHQSESGVKGPLCKLTDFVEVTCESERYPDGTSKCSTRKASTPCLKSDVKGGNNNNNGIKSSCQELLHIHMLGCQPPCANGGTCVEDTRRCECTPGVTGIACQDDINECAILKPGYCQHQCVNTIGSFYCACPKGFSLNADHRTCSASGCLPGCQNGGKCVKGSCQCPAGLTGPLCQTDIDECEKGSHLCQGKCLNTFGSFTCVCPPGSRLDHKDGRTCINTTCKPPCANGGQCANDQCQCGPGFTGTFCQLDLNECRQKLDNCSHFCINTRGSFQCSCPKGYNLVLDGVTCLPLEVEATTLK